MISLSPFLHRRILQGLSQVRDLLFTDVIEKRREENNLVRQQYSQCHQHYN